MELSEWLVKSERKNNNLLKNLRKRNLVSGICLRKKWKWPLNKNRKGKAELNRLQNLLHVVAADPAHGDPVGRRFEALDRRVGRGERRTVDRGGYLGDVIAVGRLGGTEGTIEELTVLQPTYPAWMQPMGIDMLTSEALKQ